jgi:uncharacterized membrane protein
MDSGHVINLVEVGFELVGVAILVIGSLVALATCAATLRRGRIGSNAYRALRTGVGRAIMLGLEFLVAADIIRSVAIEPTLQSVGVLGLIVVVRTFLSWSLEIEITGHLPWRRVPAIVAEGAPDNLDEL